MATHDENVKINNSTSLLNDEANEYVDLKFTVENLRSIIPLRNGLPVSASTSEADYKDARDTQYNEFRYSGISTRSNELKGSATEIHSTTLKPELPEPIPPTTNNEGDIEDREIEERKSLTWSKISNESSSIIVNNPNIAKGVYQDKPYDKSFGVVVGGVNSKQFGKISNKESSFDRTTSRPARTTTTPVTATTPRSTKEDRSFSTISNTSNSIPFGIIHNNKNSIQKTSELGLDFSKFDMDYFKVPRY